MVSFIDNFILKLIKLSFLFVKELINKMASALPVGEVDSNSFGKVDDVAYRDVLMV